VTHDAALIRSSSTRCRSLTACELLVSVRDPEEAAIAVSAGVDVIDFKEPSRGPLAAVDPSVWQNAASRFPNQSLSAALGESDSAVSLAGQVPAGFRFAKVGPSWLKTVDELAAVWDRVSVELPPGVELVPVAYADHTNARCVGAEEVLERVIATGRQRWLVDTFCKDGRTLADHVSIERLTGLLTRAREAGVWVAMAGSIGLSDVMRLSEYGVTPDCWGVRGDVCRANSESSGEKNRDTTRRREGELDRDRIDKWLRAMGKCVS